MERLERLFLAAVEGLPDVDEGGKIRVERPERARNPRTDMWGSDRERRLLGSVPVVLVAAVQDKAEVGGAVGFDECAAVHHGTDLLKALAEL